MRVGILVLAGAVVAASGASGQERPSAAPAEGPRIDCRGTGAAEGRRYVFDRPGQNGPWRLSYRAGGDERWVRLALPGARPAIEGGTARLSYRNANGGRQIDLSVTREGARLDVWVDYGLDVNIEPDLDPAVDEMNTHGPLTTVACAVAPAAP